MEVPAAIGAEVAAAPAERDRNYRRRPVHRRGLGRNLCLDAAPQGERADRAAKNGARQVFRLHDVLSFREGRDQRPFAAAERKGCRRAARCMRQPSESSNTPVRMA